MKCVIEKLIQIAIIIKRVIENEFEIYLFY